MPENSTQQLTNENDQKNSVSTLINSCIRNRKISRAGLKILKIVILISRVSSVAHSVIASSHRAPKAIERVFSSQLYLSESKMSDIVIIDAPSVFTAPLGQKGSSSTAKVISSKTSDKIFPFLSARIAFSKSNFLPVTIP